MVAPTSILQGYLPWMHGGDAWEDLVHELLRRHHGKANYQVVKSTHQGDYGVDGFSDDGCAYQCYACIEPLRTEERYKKHRSKMRDDTKKFVDNRADLEGIFGRRLIHRWVFVVPVQSSAKLLQYASTRTSFILKHSLPYVQAADFAVKVMELGDFASEFRAYLHDLPAGLRIPFPLISDDVVNTFVSADSAFVANLRRKLQNIATETQAHRLPAAMVEMVRDYLRSEEALSIMRRDLNERWQSAISCRSSFESGLAYELGGQKSEHGLRQYVNELTELLEKQVGLDRESATQMSRGSVILALGACSLDF